MKVQLLISGLLLTLLPGSQLRAQRYLIEQATAQAWAGGPAHYSGVRYRLRLRSEQGLLPPPDSIWLRGEDGALAPSSVTPVPIREAGWKGYEVLFNSVSSGLPGPAVAARPAPRRPPRPFRGAALLGYRYRGAWYYVEVRAFTRLPSLSYP